MDVNERFWTATLQEMKQGYLFDQVADSYYCLVCGQPFLNGEVFREASSGRFFEARTYAGLHVQERHGSMLQFLLGLDKKTIGLTDLQKELIAQFASGLSDSEIVKRAGSGSASTIRNHRFVLKEKAKQAKLLLAVMELMDAGATGAPAFMPIHRTATQVDERYALTEEEYSDVLRKYFPNGPDGPLKQFPSKEKRKIAVLRHIATHFEAGVSYREKEVNELLAKFWNEDYVTLRRYLIQYGYLDRKEDGSAYWVKLEGKDVSAMQRPNALKEQGGEKQIATQHAGKPDKETRKQLTSQYQERERLMGVYQIKNKLNGRMYIGGSTNLDGLWNKEKFMLDFGSHVNKELQREWKQFGGEQFQFIILETVKSEDGIRYDYKDVVDEEGKELGDVVRQYKREIERLKEKWMEQLLQDGDRGYH